MSVLSPTVTRATLPASNGRVTAQPDDGLPPRWFAVLCCVISILATALFVERHRQDAWRAAERELAVVAGVAVADLTRVSAQIAGTNDERDHQLTQGVSAISERIFRLAGKPVVLIDPQGKLLFTSALPMVTNITQPARQTIARATPGAVFTLQGEGTSSPVTVYTQRVPGVSPAPLTIAVLAPEREILASFLALRRDAVAACVGFMLIVLTLAWAFSRPPGRRDALSAALRDRDMMLDTQRSQLSETYRIAQIGHFYWDLVTDALTLQGDDQAIFGCTPSQYFRTMHEWQENFCHPDDRRAVAENQATKIQRGEPYAVQRRTLTPDGHWRWLDVLAEPVFDVSGKAVAYRGVFRDITAHKTTEILLKESEEKYRLISENMRDQVALLTRSGTVLYASPSTMALLGFDADASIGKSPYKRIHPDDRGRVNAAAEQLASSPGVPSVSTEYRYRHRDGHYLWLQTVIAPVRDDHGAIRHFQASTRNVTQRRNAEERLRRSEERFRALTEISSDWYWETDDHHRFSFLSLQQTVLTKQNRAEILGRTRWQLFPDSLTPEEWREHRQTLEAHRPFQGLVIRMFKAGHTQPIGYFSVSGRPVFGGDAVFLGYRGIGRDITSMKLNERQLAESEERYRLITQNMRDVISLHAIDGKLFYVSPSFSAITGHDLGAIVGVSARHLLHPDDALSVRRRYVQLIRGRDVAPRLTYRLRHRAGHYLWLESQITLVQAAGGSLLHVQIVSRDVTARREAEIAVDKKAAELAKTNKLLAVEVHARQELERNILMTIEMELAQVGLELHDELGQDLTGIALLSKSLEKRLAEKGLSDAAEATRICELVNRTIRHTRAISHGLSPYILGTDGLVAALSQLAGDISSLGVVECSTMLDSNISIDDELVARSLYRIAQESINNALKHSRAQRLTLSLTNRKEGVELSIADNGAGHAAMTGHLESGGRFHSIRHRCRAINAVLTVRRCKDGGTMVRVVWHRSASLPTPESYSRRAPQ